MVISNDKNPFEMLWKWTNGEGELGMGGSGMAYTGLHWLTLAYNNWATGFSLLL